MQDIIHLSEKHIVRLTFSASAEDTPIFDEEHTEFRLITLAEIAKRDKEPDEFTREILERDLLT